MANLITYNRGSKGPSSATSYRLGRQGPKPTAKQLLRDTDPKVLEKRRGLARKERLNRAMAGASVLRHRMGLRGRMPVSFPHPGRRVG